MRLGQEVVISPESNMLFLRKGAQLSIDECCLSFKIFMGHVSYLLDKCDLILVPRLDSFGKNERACVKFNALPDLVRNSLTRNVIDYNIDVLKGQHEQAGFITMGKQLGFSRLASLRAYKAAKQLQEFANLTDGAKQMAALKGGGLKVMLVGHPYNCHDALIGTPVAKVIARLGVKVIYANKFFYDDCAHLAKDYSPTLSWTHSKHLVGAVRRYGNQVDGIIFLSTFPCGPDSLINELMLRKLKGIPVCNIIVDELQAENGLCTRIESFLDIIAQRRNYV